MTGSDVDISVLCDPDAPYAHLREPHRVVLDGEPWTLGTCSTAAVLVPGAAASAPAYDIGDSLTRGPVIGVTTLGVLREWAGPATAPAGCPDCGGKSEHNCPDCGAWHLCDGCDGIGTLPPDVCERCGGSGTLPPASCWAALVVGSVYDATLVARWLVAVAGRPDGEEVTVCHDAVRRMLHGAGDGWLAVQMGSREATPPVADPSRPPLRFQPRRAAP